MSAPPPALGAVTLLSGPAEFLAAQALDAVMAAVRATEPDADITETAAGDIHAGALAELVSPSLFATARAVVVRDLQDLPEEVHGELLAYAASPAPDVALMLVHPGGPKGRRLLDQLRKAGVCLVACEKPSARELPRFVTTQARRLGGSITDEAAEFLVAAVGVDLRSLTGAVGQLVSDHPSARLTIEVVRRYYDGRAEVKSFDIADAALDGQLPLALERLRWALGNGVPSLFVLSAFASGLRSLARLQGASRGMREADLAREIGVPGFRVRSLRSTLRCWSPPGLAGAISAVAQADLEVKGGAGDTDHALERMVIAVVGCRA